MAAGQHEDVLGELLALGAWLWLIHTVIISFKYLLERKQSSTIHVNHYKDEI